MLIEGPEGCTLNQRSMPTGGASVVINLFNDTIQEVRIYWIDYLGNWHDYGSRRPSEEFEILTTSNQLFMITGMDGTCLGTVASKPNLQSDISTYVQNFGTPSTPLNGKNETTTSESPSTISEFGNTGTIHPIWVLIVLVLLYYTLA